MDEENPKRMKVLDVCSKHGIWVEGPEGERGVIAPLKEGEPLSPSAQIISFTPSEEEGYLDMTVEYRPGPAKVATPKYRRGWENVFGNKANPGGLN